MKIEEVTFQNNRGARLDGRIHHPDGPSRGGVVFCHGLFSSKDAYKIVNLSGEITAAGFTLLAFDFSFVSAMPGSFRDFSIYQEVCDLESAASFLLERGVSSLHLAGSSMGGVVALLFAASRPAFLRSLTLIATPVDLSNLLATLSGSVDFKNLPKGGTTTIDGIPIHNEFFHEALSLDMQEAMRSVSVPVLVIHGARDAVVDVQNAHLLEDSLVAENRVILVPDGDHNLTRKEDIRLLRSAIIPWISTHEKNAGRDR
ncbi:MAG TPA: alpha/beta fold hydrolase [Spirochaetota bacterium]|nr:alpha/beta fold hydrolase [Spirochaetota bacterium]